MSSKRDISLKLTTDKTFYTFLVASLLMAMLVSLIFVGLRSDSVVKGLLLESSRIEAKLATSNLSQFLNTRRLIVQDLASHPILVNGVMGSGRSSDYVSDLLDEYQILGNSETTYVVNILSEPIYSNSKNPFQDMDEAWLNSILEGESPYAIVLEKRLTQGERPKHYFKIAVPIYYNGFTEGVLLVAFSSPLETILSLENMNEINAIRLTGEWVKFSNVIEGEEYFEIGTGAVGTTSIHFDYLVRERFIANKTLGFMYDIAWAVALSLMLSFFFLYIFGRHLILNPFKALETSQATLKDSEERFKLAVDGSNDGLWDWDLLHQSVYYSPRFKQLLGYGHSGADSDDFFQQSTTQLQELIHPDDRQLVYDSIVSHLKYETPFDVEYRLKTFSGEYRYFRAKGLALREGNRATRMAGSLTDVTDQKLYQQALKKAKEHNDLLAQAIDSSNVGVSIADATQPDFPLVFINSTFTKITGYDQSVLGKNCRFLQGEETDPAAIEQIRSAIDNHKVRKVELINYKKSGAAFWNSLQISPVFDDEKNVVAYVGIQQDITELIAQKDALKEAKHQAERAAIAKSEFLASMSHEIRTPMNGVLGMLNLLMNSELNPEQYHRVKVAMSSANSLLSLINDILDFSKVEAGKLELEILEFDIRTMLGELAEATALQAQSKGLELILNIRNVELGLVKGDPSRIRQVITNLIGNAVKFTESGEIVIEASLKEEDEVLWFICDVTDTGIGIPQSKQSALFDSFSQVDASTTRKYGGTGLGLAIVKKLCELMGGEITVSSEVGHGSTFTVKIKLEKAAGQVKVKPKVNMSELELLIVDDNSTNLEVLRGQLEHWGAKVTQAESAIEALSLCESRVEQSDTFFDIALLDMHMPNMSGDKLGQILAKDPRFNSMKLIMMTSMGSQGDAKYFAELGFSGYFPKPATTNDLFDALSVVAEGGQALSDAKPLVTSHYLKTLKSPIDEKPKQDSVTWSSSPRLLLAEDNQVNQIVATSMLKKLGFDSIDIAGNGLEVIQYLKADQSDQLYSLILMDCQMPEMDGYETTRRIRKGKAGEMYKNIPIVAMTANAMVGDKAKCIEAGMDDYLSKPISTEALVERLKVWLEHEIVDQE